MLLNRVSITRASVVVSLVGASLCAAHCQQSVQSLVDELNESHKRLPDFAGLYQETLKAPNSNPEKKAENVFSWGISDSKLNYQYAFGPTKSYSHMLPVGNSEIERAVATIHLCEKGKRTIMSCSEKRQGDITVRPPGFRNPVGVGYELRMGEGIADAIKSGGAKIIGPDTVQFHYVYDVVVKFKRFGGQLVAESFSQKTRGFSSDTTVTKWIEHKGSYFPSEVQDKQIIGGKLKTITYTLIKTIPLPSDYVEWAAWKDGANVRDHDEQLTYVFKKGKLLLDPRFKANAERLKAKRTRVIAELGIGGAAVTGLLIFFLRRRRTVKPKAA